MITNEYGDFIIIDKEEGVEYGKNVGLKNTLEHYGDNLHSVRSMRDGVGVTLEFENGYGIDITRASGTVGYEDGLWEVAVVKFGDEGLHGLHDWKLNYDTPITNNVIGYCDDERVANIAEETKELGRKRIFIMPIGVAGSGKSTLGEYLEAANETLVVVSSDEIRKELYGSEEIQTDPKRVFEEMENRSISLLKDGYDVFYDATNLERNHRESTLNKISENVKDVNKVACVLTVDVEQAISQNNGRDRKVPEDIIRSMGEKLKEQPPTKEEGFDFMFSSDNISQKLSELKKISGELKSLENHEAMDFDYAHADVVATENKLNTLDNFDNNLDEYLNSNKNERKNEKLKI